MFDKRDLEEYLRKDAQTEIITAAFNVLRDHVENQLAKVEVEINHQYPLLMRLFIRYTPLRFRRQASRDLGLAYLDSKISLLKVATLQQADNKIRELYLWYVDEFPMMKNPYQEIEDPEHFFITDDGTPTSQLFSVVDGKGVVNNFHPDYLNYLNQIDALKRKRNEILDTKLSELAAIRRYI